MRFAQGWLRPTTILLLVVATFTGCISPPERRAYQVHPGPPLPDAEVAVVMLGDAAVARFDGLTAVRGDWTEVRLRPGPHRIEWATDVPEASSPLADLAWLSHAMRFEAVLEAGHTYSLRNASDSGLLDETTARPVPTQPWEAP